MAVYFFFVISITSDIIATINVTNRNIASYVTISTALLSEGEKLPSKRRGLTAYRI